MLRGVFVPAECLMQHFTVSSWLRDIHPAGILGSLAAFHEAEARTLAEFLFNIHMDFKCFHLGTLK